MFDLNTKILVADDMSVMRKTVVKACRDLGFLNFAEAKDGSEAWQLLASENHGIGFINRLLGEAFTEIQDDTIDTAAEILNIVYTLSRVPLNGTKYNFQPALPSAIRGGILEESTEGKRHEGKLIFESDLGPFAFQASLSLKTA